MEKLKSQMYFILVNKLKIPISKSLIPNLEKIIFSVHSFIRSCDKRELFWPTDSLEFIKNYLKILKDLKNDKTIKETKSFLEKHSANYFAQKNLCFIFEVCLKRVFPL